MWNTFDVNVLVNGNRCKQYDFQNRKYIESKDDSEWYFQIQNNTPGRVLAVCSVDGLNVLSGETASPSDSGYIIDAYHSQKIKGFRLSDDDWALFKFGYKLKKDLKTPNKKVYAVSKGGGAEKNCGVVGVKLFYEVPKVIEYVPQENIKWYSGGISGSYANYTGTCSYSLNASSLNSSYTITGAINPVNIQWTPDTTTNYSSLFGGCAASKKTSNDNSINFSLQNMAEDHYIPVKEKTYSNKLSAPKPKKFDMGTEFGRREVSKVVTVDFERGCEAFSTDIYYASREALIEMGVPITNYLKTNLPKSFPNKYCTPPRDWNG